MNKAALKRLALEVRSEVGTALMEPFDPYELAREYGIQVVPLSELDCSVEAREHFASAGLRKFSGALVPVDNGRVIIENDAHDSERRRSTASHEMAHVLLEHEFAAALVDERGCRAVFGEQEDEAAELGGELLIPAEAARRLALRDYSDGQVAEKFQVSVKIAQWRMNATGARIIAQRARSKSSSSRR